MQSCNLHRHDAVQGFGCSPTSVLQRKKCFCIDENIACRCRHCLYVCPACGCYEISQRAFQIWKSFCNQDRPFSSSTWSGRLFFCSGGFCVCIHRKQVLAQECASSAPQWSLNKQIFWEKFVSEKSALIHPILHQTGPITSGFENKKRN